MVPLHTPESAPGSPGSPLSGDSSKPSRVVVLCCDDLDQRWLVQRLALLGQLHLRSKFFLQCPGYRFEPWQRLVGAVGGQG